jgi:hypothetical protein
MWSELSSFLYIKRHHEQYKTDGNVLIFKNEQLNEVLYLSLVKNSGNVRCGGSCGTSVMFLITPSTLLSTSSLS